MKLKLSILLIVVCLMASAQTQTTLNQHSGPIDTTWRLLAISPTGQQWVIDVGSGLSIELVNGRPTLKVLLPPTPTYTEVRKVVVVPVGGGTVAQQYVLDHSPVAGRLKVYRNGVLQYEAISGKGDYTLANNTVTFLPVPLGDGSTVPAVTEGDAIQFIYFL